MFTPKSYDLSAAWATPANRTEFSGLAVIGYANRMWSTLCQESRAGWVAPLGNAQALADAVVEAAKNWQRLAASCRVARNFAGQHSFENKFRSRIEHLRKIAEG